MYYNIIFDKKVLILGKIQLVTLEWILIFVES